MSSSGDRISTGPRSEEPAATSGSAGDPTGNRNPDAISFRRRPTTESPVSPERQVDRVQLRTEPAAAEVYIRPSAGRRRQFACRSTAVSVRAGAATRAGNSTSSSLVVLSSMIASEIRLAALSIRREIPPALFQSLYSGEIHEWGESHPYGVSPDGQRFLVPQFDDVNAAFGRGGPGGFPTAIPSSPLPVTADRQRIYPTSGSRSTAPITVVINWLRR